MDLETPRAKSFDILADARSSSEPGRKREWLILNTLYRNSPIQGEAPAVLPRLDLSEVWTWTGDVGGASGEIALADDAELITGLMEDNPLGLSLLFQRYAGLVLAVAVRILRNRSEAEEVVQEVFLYIYERPHVFDPAKGSARKWIMRIAGSRALDRRLYLARRGFYAGVDSRSLHDTLPARSDLEVDTISALNREHLERAFEVLTEMQRQTIECFYFGGLELREISSLLGEPLANVRHHLYRGLARLRRSTVLRNLCNGRRPY